MKFNSKMQQGFTLIEIAIVLVVVTVLLGYTVAMFPVQQELKQYRKAESEMNSILEHLVAFAQVNGRLPCPDTTGDVNGEGPGILDGQEDWDDQFDNINSANPADGFIDSCKSYFGFLPAGTLGLNGDISPTGQLLDPWGQAYGYHVSNVDAVPDALLAGIDLVSPNGIREEGIANVQADLFVCDDSAALGFDLTCVLAASNPVVSNVAAVVISLGKDFNQVGSSNIQTENFDNFHDGTLDKVYVSATRSDVNNAEYDDVVKWLSTNVLFSKMIAADQLP